jgi:hypothetical protein
MPDTPQLNALFQLCTYKVHDGYLADEDKAFREGHIG